MTPHPYAGPIIWKSLCRKTSLPPAAPAQAWPHVRRGGWTALDEGPGLTFPLTFFVPIFLHHLLASLSDTSSEQQEEEEEETLISLRRSSNLD